MSYKDYLQMIEDICTDIGVCRERTNSFKIRYRGLYFDKNNHPSRSSMKDRISRDVLISDIPDVEKARKFFGEELPFEPNKKERKPRGCNYARL